MKKDDFVDDGRTIADMSGIERPSLFIPQALKRKKTSEQPLDLYEDKERFWIIMGALKASLLIGLAYIVGLGLIILVLYLFFMSRL